MMMDKFEPGDENSKELFTFYGLAVYYSQALEQQLANLIMVMKLSQGDLQSEEQFNENFRKKLGSSLGQLVNEIQHHFSFTDEESAQLKAIWKQRNYIVHDYFKLRIHEAFIKEGREKMIAELRTFCDEARAMEMRLQQYTERMLKQLDMEK
ncbi:hypothetical protein [Paenibacillus aceti]|uniref:Apea-like HEPN domain-containing protein n=1 Tax=Paenibacillus aceti TaxID=1820010 RepID=A0ABQ1W554_9BACL|nr:hypothetical protein [Paenibacillus aceti]GGG14856.1 hypothetical protein GCM10010913_40920 [Paenibacillus aceti]